MDHTTKLAAMNQARKLLAEARETWPEFKEHEQQIQALLESNRHMSLKDAYGTAVGRASDMVADQRAASQVIEELANSVAEAMVTRIETVGYLHR